LVGRLDELAAAIGVPPRPGWEQVAIRDICEDSRRVEPGALFVAVAGAVRDGADYIADAVARGAAGIVSQGNPPVPVPHLRAVDARAALAQLAAAFHDRPSEGMFVVGVTGTNGKTTVCHWIAHLLGAERTALISTVENERHGLRAVTTPPSPLVQRIAAQARAAGAENLVVEASSIGLEQRRLDAVDFDIAVFTNLTHDHLDLHGTVDAYLGAKRILFAGLKGSGHAVVNDDDPASDRLLEGCRARRWRYGFRPGADLCAVDPRRTVHGARCRLTWQGRCAPVVLPHPGEHNLSNALAAATAALLGGVSLEEIAERLHTAPAVDGRLQMFSRPDGVTAVVDFAHSPDALEKVLRTIRPSGGRVLLVFGCAGESDVAKRPMMGQVARRLADRVILTADNPKHEDLGGILDQIEVGMQASPGGCWRIPDRAEAVRFAVAAARPGDVVVLAGKGPETYQILGDEFTCYSDRRVLEDLGFTEGRGGRR